MKKMRKRLGVLLLVLSMTSSFGIGYAEESDSEKIYDELYSDAEVYAANDVALLSEDSEDTTVMFENYGESEEEVKAIKRSNTNISMTTDYKASGEGSLLVEVTGAYGSMQFPFDIEKGKLYKLTYAAAIPEGVKETYLQSNIYAQPKGAHQGQIRLQSTQFNRYTKIIYYPDTEFTNAWYGFYCNNAGDKFLIDDIKMVRYDDFGISKTSAFYDGIKGVGTFEDIYLKLNYDVNAGSIGNISITDKDGNEKSVTVNDVIDKNTLVLQHDIFENDTEYTLKIDSVADTVGRTAKDISVNFTTIDEVSVNDMKFNKDSITAGEIGLTGTLTNNSLNEKNVTVKIWLYSDLTMVQRVSVPVTIPMMGTESLENISMNITDLPKGGYTLAASVWEDDVNKRPLCKSIWLGQ